MKAKLFFVSGCTIFVSFLLGVFIYFSLNLFETRIRTEVGLSEQLSDFSTKVEHDFLLLGSGVSQLYATSNSVDGDPILKRIDNILADLKKNSQLVQDPKFVGLSGMDVPYEAALVKSSADFQKGEIAKLTPQQDIKNLSTLITQFKGRLTTAIQVRQKQWEDLDALNSDRNELAKLFRESTYLNANNNSDTQNLGRAVLTVLSSQSLKDIAYAGRAIFNSAADKLKPMYMGTKNESQWLQLNELFQKTRGTATRALAASDDYGLLMEETQKLAKVAERIRAYSKQQFNQKLQAVTQSSTDLKYKSLAGLLSVLGVTILGILVLKRSLFELGGFQTKLSQVVLQMSDVSNHMKTVSSQLSSNAHQSASSVQESVSALAEMSSMLTATASNTEETAQICVGVQEKGTQGLQIMEELCGAMDRLDQMSLKLKEILDIIDAVSVKTGVINEVVFKTQLLSVNASIEAARAGQYGKGFAVVAQEVSELASLSGKASGDIRQMLEDSKLKVAQIVRDTSQAIQQGSNVSSSSVSTFKDILGSVDAISRKVIEISQATREQELGVQQTMAAAEQLNVSTSDTNQAAHQSVQFAESLQERAQDLFGVSTQFKNLIGDGQFLKALENRRNSAGIWTAGDLDSLKKSLDFSKPLVGEKEEMVEWRKSA